VSDPHETAEVATPAQLRRASLHLLVMFAALYLLVVPFLRDLPLGPTARTGLLAWLLVVLSLYWLYAGLGYRPLLLLQVFAFSIAAVLLATKVGLVLVGINRLSILRRTGRLLILIGGGLGLLNLGAMVYALLHHSRHFPLPPPRD
jgi:hypothetical protein